MESRRPPCADATKGGKTDVTPSPHPGYAMNKLCAVRQAERNPARPLQDFCRFPHRNDEPLRSQLFSLMPSRRPVCDSAVPSREARASPPRPVSGEAGRRPPRGPLGPRPEREPWRNASGQQTWGPPVSELMHFHQRRPLTFSALPSADYFCRDVGLSPAARSRERPRIHRDREPGVGGGGGEERFFSARGRRAAVSGGS